MRVWKAHICFVSDQPLPNLLPVLNQELKPEKVYLLCSGQQKEKGNCQAQQDVLTRRGVKVEIIDIPDAFDRIAIQKVVEDIINLHDNQKELVLNATGGTKPMSFAAFEQCFNDDVSVFYVQTPKIIWLYVPKEIRMDMEQNALEIEESFSIGEYLQAHGVSVERLEVENIPEKRKTLAKRWADRWEEYKKSYSRLNKFTSEAKNFDLLMTVPKAEARGGQLEDLLRELEEADESNGLLKFDPDRSDQVQDTYRFKSEGDRAFVNGKWLEEHVYDLLSSMKEKYPRIMEVARNVEVSRYSGNKINIQNELDVVAIVDQQMWVFECKTGSTQNKEGKNKFGSDVVYKLASLMKGMGGSRTRGCIVSCNQLHNVHKSRAKILDIHVIDGRSVRENNLRSKLVTTLGLDQER